MVLPWRRIVLVSPLRPEEALTALESAIESRKGWKDKLLSTGSGKFAGEVTGERFSIVRDIGYRNNFLPQVTGTITPGTPASRIEVSMTADPKVLVLAGLWLFIMLFNCFNILRSMVSAGGHADYTFLEIMGGIMLFGLAM